MELLLFTVKLVKTTSLLFVTFSNDVYIFKITLFNISSYSPTSGEAVESPPILLLHYV